MEGCVQETIDQILDFFAYKEASKEGGGHMPHVPPRYRSERKGPYRPIFSLKEISSFTRCLAATFSIECSFIQSLVERILKCPSREKVL